MSERDRCVRRKKYEVANRILLAPEQVPHLYSKAGKVLQTGSDSLGLECKETQPFIGVGEKGSHPLLLRSIRNSVLSL